jgi:hypothetical protein
MSLFLGIDIGTLPPKRYSSIGKARFFPNRVPQKRTRMDKDMHCAWYVENR